MRDTIVLVCWSKHPCILAMTHTHTFWQCFWLFAWQSHIGLLHPRNLAMTLSYWFAVGNTHAFWQCQMQTLPSVLSIWKELYPVRPPLVSTYLKTVQLSFFPAKFGQMDLKFCQFMMNYVQPDRFFGFLGGLNSGCMVCRHAVKQQHAMEAYAC